MATPRRPLRVPASTPRGRRAHHPNRLDHQLARAAVGWSIWADVGVEEIADRLLTLAGGNRTALERALRRFRPGDAAAVAGAMLEKADTTAGRAAAALHLALARGGWAKER